MAEKYAVNQRIKQVMDALGEPRVDPFYKKYWGKDAVSEKLRTIVAEETGVKTDFIVEFTEKIADRDNKKINGHWLLTGEGEMFFSENGTPAKESSDNYKNGGVRESVYKSIVEGHTEYMLVPRSILNETQLVSTEQIKRTWDELAQKNIELAEKNKELDTKNKQIDFYQGQFARLMENLELATKSSDSKKVKDKS